MSSHLDPVATAADEPPREGAEPRGTPPESAPHGLRPRGRPVLLIRLESAWRRRLVLALTLVGAAWLAWVILAPAVAEHLARRATTVGDLERALAWDPGDPERQLVVGHVHLGVFPPDLAKARGHLAEALRFRPTHAGTWLALARLAEREQDTPRARQTLATALAYDPHNVVVRWEGALLALRWGDQDAALEHFRYVLAVDPARRYAAFQLARRLLPSGEAPESLLPADAEALAGILRTALRHQDLDLARAAWERRAPLEPPVPPDLLRRYLEVLLQAGEAVEARRLWATLVPDEAPASPGNAVWNGGFEADTLLGWGFDWQVRRHWGVEVALDRFVAAQGRQSLRLAFNSFPTLDFAGVFQAVAVEPGQEYRLRALVRALDFMTRSGLKLQVVTPDDDDDEEEVLAETPAISGTTPDWVPLEGSLRVPDGVTMVHLRVRREPSEEPEGNLGGKVWLDEVSLTPAGRAGDG